jgi:hypothetical protein
MPAAEKLFALRELATAPPPAQLAALITGHIKPAFPGAAEARQAWRMHWRAVQRVHVLDRQAGNGARRCWAAGRFALPPGARAYLAALNGLRRVNAR